MKATTKPDELPDCELGIVATKATQVDESVSRCGPSIRSGSRRLRAERIGERGDYRYAYPRASLTGNDFYEWHET